jgi:hypothetical protein
MGEINSRLLPLQPVAIQDHVSYTVAVCGWTLINIKSLIADLIPLVLTHESHFIFFDPDISFASAAVPDVNKSGAIAEDLDSILSRVPASAKVVVLRSEILL